MPATKGTPLPGSRTAYNALVTDLTSGSALVHQVVAADGSGGLAIEPLRKSIVLVYDDYAIQDYDDLVVCNKGTAMTATLPEAIGSGAVHIIKNIGVGTVTVMTTVYDLLDSDGYLGGVDSEDVEQWKCLTVCDCAYGLWVIISRNVSTSNSALTLGYTAKTADYTATEDDCTIAVTCSVADVTITLPAAAGCAGRIYNIKKMDATAYDVIVEGDGAETIDGDTTLTITSQYDNAQIQSTGAAWIIL